MKNWPTAWLPVRYSWIWKYKSNVNSYCVTNSVIITLQWSSRICAFQHIDRCILVVSQIQAIRQNGTKLCMWKWYMLFADGYHGHMPHEIITIHKFSAIFGSVLRTTDGLVNLLIFGDEFSMNIVFAFTQDFDSPFRGNVKFSPGFSTKSLSSQSKWRHFIAQYSGHFPLLQYSAWQFLFIFVLYRAYIWWHKIARKSC